MKGRRKGLIRESLKKRLIGWFIGCMVWVRRRLGLLRGKIKFNKNNGYHSFSISSILNPVCSDINLLSSPEFFKLLAIA